VHIAGAVYGTHPTDADHFLNRISIGKLYARLKLTRSGGALIAPII
jgi:hypothetical protein